MGNQKGDLEIKKILDEYNKDVKRHFDVALESVKDDVKIIAEQYGDIRRDIGSIKETLDSHTEMIGSMKEDVEIIKSDIEFIKGSLKKKVDYDEFIALERRMTLLESKVRR